MSEKKPTYKAAVGLEYEGGRENAPTISAKGEHLSADEVVKIARRYGIPVVERAGLARSLLPLEVDQQIPEDLYETVAALLHEVDKISK